MTVFEGTRVAERDGPAAAADEEAAAGDEGAAAADEGAAAGDEREVAGRDSRSGGGQLLQLAASVRLALVHFLRVLQLPVLPCWRPQVLLLVQRLLV